MNYTLLVNRLSLLIPLSLSACAGTLAAVPPPAGEVRPIVVGDRLQGRWTITAVDGRPAKGPWLELGGEGLGTATDTGNGVLIGSPSPATRAYLGCNTLHLNGWARNGDKLTLGTDYAMKTERGCDLATMEVEEQVHAILRKVVTMELTPPDHLRLINEVGTLDLQRAGH